MKRFLPFILIVLITHKAFAVCSSQISRTNFSANSVLTSSELNSQFNTAYNRVNDLPGDCIQDDTIDGDKLTDGTVELAKLTTLAQGSTGTVGEVKMFHTFNGTVSLPRGWMILNGDTVTQANYDAIHGAGSYVTDGVSLSVLLNKNLPNMVGKFPKGASATTQDGSSAITATGNASNQVNLSHTHTITDHNHEWMTGTSPSTLVNTTYNSAGATVVTPANYLGTTGGTIVTIDWGAVQSLFTSNEVLTPANSLSATQSIEPAGNEFIYIIKVI